MEVRGLVMWMLLMCYIFGHIITCHNNGFVEAKSFSKSEDLEIEKNLKTINKPAVKIIKTIDGERYGCVDFFKQPAFDHPSMKNHTYHYKMRPTLKGMRERKTNNSDKGFGYLWENGVGCPIGTVPIRRVTKEDLLELNSFEDQYKPHGSWNTTTYDPDKVVHYYQHHTIDGERYGCVDFFKQPAFDHPSMKNHTYHYKMRPTLKGMRERKTNNSDKGFGYLWENGVGCPIGTVPIRRVTKEDLLGLNSLDDKYKPRGSWNTTTYDPNNVVHYDQHHFAVGRTKNIGMHYHGATMDLCITAPKVRPTQFSASRLHMQMGDDFIQTGFTVYPALYKDNQPRTYVYTPAGGKSCYNSHCDVGIIMVREDFPLGMAMKPVSVRGAKRSHYGIFGLIKDQANGNWWLEFGRNAEEVGFRPSQRFRQRSGNFVEWGGEVYSASLPSPQMGYGDFPTEQLAYDQYIKRISILDGNYQVDRKVNHIEKISDNLRGYDVSGMLSKTPDIGRIVYFGGPGNI